MSRVSKDNQVSQDHQYVNALSPLWQILGSEIVAVTLYITVCAFFRVHQVLQAKLEGKGSLGSKVKGWVQITHLAVSDLHPKSLFFVLKILIFFLKGNDGAQGSQGSTGPPGSPGSPGLMVYACYNAAFYLSLTHYNIRTIQINPHLHSLCVFAMKGPPWHWRNGRKRWETRAAGELHTCITGLACSHTRRISQHTLKPCYR